MGGYLKFEEFTENIQKRTVQIENIKNKYISKKVCGWRLELERGHPAGPFKYLYILSHPRAAFGRRFGRYKSTFRLSHADHVQI